jgi:nicotinamide riboside kinase
LRIARTREQFLQLVEEALRENDAGAATRRQAAVASGTWDARAEHVSELIERVLRHG